MADLVVDICREIARQCSVPDPGSWSIPETEEAIEVKGFLQDAAEDFLDRFDFGVAPAVQASYPDPVDFQTYRPPSPRTAMRLARDWPPISYPLGGAPTRPVAVRLVPNLHALEAIRAEVPSPPSDQQFAYWQDDGIAFWNAADREIKVLWMTNEWVNAGDSAPKAAFDDEMDTTPLPRRALVAGAVARFRRRNGMPHEALFFTADDIFRRWARQRDTGGPRKVNIANGIAVGNTNINTNINRQETNVINRVTFNPLPPPFGGIPRG